MVIALLLLAVGLAANVLLGPLGLGLIEWRVSPNGLNQTYGADAASLLLVVPAALAAARLWWGRHRLAAPLALGVGLATLYYAVAEMLGGDYLRYAGNNERFALLFLALVILGWTIAAHAWAALDPDLPHPPRWLAHSLGVVLVLGGVVIGLAWLAQILDIALTGTVGPEYTDSPSAFWTIRIVDLGFLVPICLATGVGLWRGSAAAVKAAFGVAAFLTLQAAAVLAMGGVMLWRDDPTSSPALVYALAPITLALAACTGALLRSYVGVTPAATPRQTPAAAQVEATTMSGDLRVADLALTDRREERCSLTGTVGGGGATVQVSTTSGAVTLTTAR